MSFLRDDETASLRVDRMILHVIGADQEFEPQEEISGVDHIEFFLARIQDVAASSVHMFNESSTTKELLADIASGRTDFVSGAQELSRRFAKDHSGNSSDGAFFVIQLGTSDPSTKLFSLIKYDYRQVVELYESGGQKALRQIVQAFVREKRAIQKSCLVRASNGEVSSEVSAVDRMAVAPDLTQYFQAFLDVRRERDTAELSQRLHEAIRLTAQHVKEHLPNGDVPAAINRVKEVLRGQEKVDEEAVADAVYVAAGRPDDETVRAELNKSVQRAIKTARLEGVEFRPEQSIFNSSPRRKIRTEEGVVVEFPGEQENQAVKRAREADGWTITIRTGADFVEDSTVPIKPGRTRQ